MSSAAPLPIADTFANVLIGTSSWSDRGLTQDSDWYPRRTMRAAERIAFYARRFGITEMETTYRFPPTPEVTAQWAARTPDGFQFDVQAWSLLTGQPTMPASLWNDLATEVRNDRRDRPKLYATHLSDGAVDECWRRFLHALAPLVSTGRLGTIILRFPRWFVPRDRTREELAKVRSRLGDLPGAVEFACPDWVTPDECERTLSLLEEHDLGFVCVDAGDDDPRGLGGVAATTSDPSVVRLLGRRDRRDDDGWVPHWRSYRYSDLELKQMLPRLAHLAESTTKLHVLVATCWRDDAVRNAEALLDAMHAPPPTRSRSAG